MNAFPSVDLGVIWGAIETAADQARLGIFLTRLDDPPHIVYVSATAARMVGRTAAELVGAPPWAAVASEDQARIRQLNENPTGGPLAIEITVVRPDGSRAPFELGSARIATTDGLFAFGYLRDVSIEHRTIEALRQSEERFRFLVEQAPDGVVILVTGKVVFINPNGIRLLGADPATVIGSPVMAYLPPADAQATMQRIGEMFRTGKDMPPSEYGVLADPKRTVEIKSMLCEWEGQRAVIAFARDVTERKAMHEKLVASDRFAALGKLAASVAHEINNPLAYAQLGIELVGRRLAKLGLDPTVLGELRGHLHEAIHGLERIAAVTADLRTFSRVDDTPPGAVDLVGVVEQSLRMVENQLRHRAQLVRRVADVAPVVGNASRLEQVFVNLLLNAVQALRAPATDVVTVAIEQIGEVVRVAIADTGHGIPPSVIDRVFDPFFTTKEVGEGMGLGLSVCKNIVEAVGGTIAIESAPTGTTVTIALPTFTRPTARPPTPPPAPAVDTSRRRLLIVDDEPFVRETLAVLLATYHEVTAVDGGGAALALLASASFDVILCDVMMPNMNGMELHHAISARFPGVERRIIFVTGGAFEPELIAFLNTSGVRCLAKPFKLEQILTAVASA